MHYTSKDVYEFISKQTNDPIVEWKICKVSWTQFPIYQSDLEFYDKISPTFNGVKYQIPAPTLCPEERQRRRLIWRNERKLYKRKCDASGKDVISTYSPDYVWKVYEQTYRWSDKWDAIEYGRNVDFGKSFNQQFSSLLHDTPQMSVINFNNQNSAYNNYLNDSKNCYMCSGSWYLEDCLFCNWTYESKDLVDCGYCSKWDNGYMNIACELFFKTNFCIECKNLSESSFCFDCESSKFCFGCVWLRNREYCIYNQQYTKDEYHTYIQQIDMSNINNILSKIEELKKTFWYNAARITSSENCLGNDIKNCKNLIMCFEIGQSEDMKYCRELIDMKKSQDVNNQWYSELEYEIMGFGYNYNVHFTLYSANCKNIYYCAFCQNCENCFGCVSLHHKQYCIFNKQYTKQEYEQLVSKIIEHMTNTWEWGEFFSPTSGVFAYNESVAQDFMPLTREEALVKWYKRQDNNYDPTIPVWANIVTNHQTVNLSSDEDILKSIFICEVSKRPFRIIKQELDFYHKHNLPLPTKHPDIRYQERMNLRPKRDIHLRTCDTCQTEILSVYSWEFTWKVFCEACYNKEIYN